MSTGTRTFAIVTPYASEPAPAAIEPGSATAAEGLLPTRWLTCPSAVASVDATPVHEVMVIPPSDTGVRRYARTANTGAPVGVGYGYPWTFVARYVTCVMPPSVTESTRVNLLPTCVCGPSV